MHLMQGIIASNPAVRVKQITKSTCGPFFNLAPIGKEYTKPWAETCLKFAEDVRAWLKENGSARYIVLSSPFWQYLLESNKLFDGDKVMDVDKEIVYEHLLRTLHELEEMGLSPIIFSPPPSTGDDLGRCLVRASYLIDLSVCDFSTERVEESTVMAYELLMRVSDRYSVVWLDRLICEDGRCSTHIGSTYIYRDKAHLSREGSAELGRETDFYRLITKPALNHRVQLNW